MAETEKTGDLNYPTVRPAGSLLCRPTKAAGVVIAVLMLTAESGHAGSNLAPAGYPDPQCGEQPRPPDRPDQFRFRAELDAYNERVSAFNAARKRYVLCLQSYVDNAASDILLIRQKIDAAINAARP